MIRLFFWGLLLFNITAFAGVLTDIQITGNEKTKDRIILRELSFHPGDTILSKDFPKHVSLSYNNLINTLLFNYVYISFDKKSNNNDSLIAKIEVEERWYFWPEIVFKFQERNFTEWLRNKNFNRLDYGTFLTQRNVRGLNETFQLLLQWGFNRKIGAYYEWPNLTKHQKNGLNIGGFYNAQNEVFTNIDEGNRMVYNEDSRSLLTNQSLFMEYVRRGHFFMRHMFRLNYDRFSLNNKLEDYNSNFFNSTFQSDVHFLSFGYKMKWDKRDSKNYPLKGNYFDVQFYQRGLGILDENVNVSYFKFNARHFIKASNRWFFSYGGFANIFVQDRVPFYFQQGLGFNRYVRGYEPYVIFGKENVLLKSNLKYAILKPRVKEFEWIPHKKFKKAFLAIYTNLFLDAGYSTPFKNNEKSLNNEFLAGAGIGLDFVTYYDLVLRVEAATNIDQLTGIYISFVAPL